MTIRLTPVDEATAERMVYLVIVRPVWQASVGQAGGLGFADSLPGKEYVSGKWRGSVRGADVAQGRKVYPLEQSLIRAEENRRNGDVPFIDQALAKILLDNADSAAKADVFIQHTKR